MTANRFETLEEARKKVFPVCLEARDYMVE